MALDKAAMRLSIKERENLMVPDLPHRSGFTPRPIERLTIRSRPHTITDIECCHFLRTPSREFTNQHPTVEQRLWTEAGKYEAPFPARPDTSYNSNIWRNFRKQFGLNFSAEGRKVTDIIAAMYPLNIPAPSNVGDNSFEKYIKETKLFQDEKRKNLAIRRTKTEVNEFKQLKYKSDGRHPPINDKGKSLMMFFNWLQFLQLIVFNYNLVCNNTCFYTFFNTQLFSLIKPNDLIAGYT